jgi:hypothetical protein
MDNEKKESPFSTSQEWYNFISKINDRNLSRQSASGFTSWALLGVIAIMFYSLIDQIHIIHLMPGRQFPILIIWASIISAIILIIIYLIVLFSFFVNISLSPRLTGKLSKKTKPVISASFFVTCLLWVLYSSYSAFSELVEVRWPFLVISLFYAMFCMFALFEPIHLRYKFGKKHTEVPFLSTFPIYQGREKYFQVAVISSFILIQLTSLVFMIIPILKQDMLLHITCIKAAIELNAIALLFLFYIQNLITSLKHAVLEDIERRIVVDQMTPDEIRKIFIENILGESTKEWLIKIKAEINKKIDDLMINYANVEIDMKAISQINKDYKHEIKTRKEELYKKLKLSFLDYEKYMNCTLEYFQRLLNQNAFADNEKEFLRNIFSEFQVKLTESRKKLKCIEEIDIDEMKTNNDKDMKKE